MHFLGLHLNYASELFIIRYLFNTFPANHLESILDLKKKKKPDKTEMKTFKLPPSSSEQLLVTVFSTFDKLYLFKI